MTHAFTGLLLIIFLRFSSFWDFPHILYSAKRNNFHFDPWTSLFGISLSLHRAPSSTLNTLPVLPSFILINSYPFFLRQHISLFGLPSQCTKRWVCWITEIYFSHSWKLEVQDQGVSIPLEDYEEESVPSPCLHFWLFSGNLCWPLACRTQIFTYIFTWHFPCVHVCVQISLCTRTPGILD